MNDIRRFPSVFISHGAPTLAIEDGEAHRFLREYGVQIGKPSAIVVMSAHFLTSGPTVTANPSPQTIHDFGGFPHDMYQIEYPAPGDAELATRIVDLLATGGVRAQLSVDRGFDHGAWVPLSLMYPEANVPIVQLSLDPRRGTEYHHRLGELLKPLRTEGVLILGSGGATHNLSEIMPHQPEAGPPDWVSSFNEWLADAITNGRTGDLLRYREIASGAARNHPTEEHYLPLLFAMGAAGEERRRARVHHSYTYGVLSMDAYEFGDVEFDE